MSARKLSPMEKLELECNKLLTEELSPGMKKILRDLHAKGLDHQRIMLILESCGMPSTVSLLRLQVDAYLDTLGVKEENVD